MCGTEPKRHGCQRTLDVDHPGGRARALGEVVVAGALCQAGVDVGIAIFATDRIIHLRWRGQRINTRDVQIRDFFIFSSGCGDVCRSRVATTSFALPTPLPQPQPRAPPVMQARAFTVVRHAGDGIR